MVEDGDRIAVAVSGGKDSLLMAKLFQELLRHGKANFTVEFISMDPGYHRNIRELLVENCSFLDIPIHLFETRIFEIAGKIAGDYPCYMCAKMRRGALYAKARELGCNKLALAHHFNDVIETTMLNMFYAGTFRTMLPKLKSAHFEGLELIRPLYYVEERHIESYTQRSGIWPLNCACMVAARRTGNKRYQIKALIAELGKQFKDVDQVSSRPPRTSTWIASWAGRRMAGITLTWTFTNRIVLVGQTGRRFSCLPADFSQRIPDQGSLGFIIRQCPLDHD